MAYADQSASSSRIVAIIIVVLIHALLGYAFVTGLAYNVVKKAAEDLNVFDVQDEPPPPEEPPPPPPDKPIEPPPVVSPPPIVQMNVPPPPTIQTVRTPPPVFVPTPVAAPPPPPPPVPTISKAAGAKGNPALWISDADYPQSAIRAEAEGTTGIAWEINAQGRVENCAVTSSSGNSDLDRAACSAITRRGRYSPALDQSGNPIRSKASRRITWRLPKD
jgi:protein TonB